MKKLIITISLILILKTIVITVKASNVEYIPEKSEISQGIYSEISNVNNDKFLFKIFSYNLPKQFFGISFDLNFDSKKVKFLSSDIQVNNQENEYLVIQKNKDNIYNFAISAKKGYLLNLNQNHQILSIQFAIIGTGDLDLSFSNVKILESSYDEKVITDKKIEALGGTLIANFSPKILTQAGLFTFSPFTIFTLILSLILIIVLSLVFYQKYLLQKKNPNEFHHGVFRT